MKLNFNNLDVKRKINQLAEICHYGIEWNRDMSEVTVYSTGGIETLAHVVSCCIVKWFGFDHCSTGETRDALFMSDAIHVESEHEFTIEKWEYLLTQYLKSLSEPMENR